MVTIQPRVQSPSPKLASALCVQFNDCGISGDLSQVKFICTVNQVCEEINSFTVNCDEIETYKQTITTNICHVLLRSFQNTNFLWHWLAFLGKRCDKMSTEL